MEDIAISCCLFFVLGTLIQQVKNFPLPILKHLLCLQEKNGLKQLLRTI